MYPTSQLVIEILGKSSSGDHMKDAGLKNPVIRGSKSVLDVGTPWILQGMILGFLI